MFLYLITYNQIKKSQKIKTNVFNSIKKKKLLYVLRCIINRGSRQTVDLREKMQPRG